MEELDTSFRPLAGIMVLIERNGVLCITLNILSVPLRGLWFLSKHHDNVKEKHLHLSVPLRDYGSYLHYYYHEYAQSEEQVSVPLRGLWFLSITIFT